MLLPCRSTSRECVTNLHFEDAVRVRASGPSRASQNLFVALKRNELRGCPARSCHCASRRAIEEADVYGRSGRSRQRLLAAAGEVRRRRTSEPGAASPRGRRTAVHAEVLTDVCTQGLHAKSARNVARNVWTVAPTEPAAPSALRRARVAVGSGLVEDASDFVVELAAVVGEQ